MKKLELEVYADGIVLCSVCTNAKTPKIVERLVNQKHPTGIQSPWRISKDKFKTGESNPCPCDKKPKTHLHYLMEC